MIFLRLSAGFLLQVIPFAVLTLYPYCEQLRFSKKRSVLLTLWLILGLSALFAGCGCYLQTMLPPDHRLFQAVNVVFLLCILPCLGWYLYLVPGIWQKKLFVFSFALTGGLIITSINNTICTLFVSPVLYDGLPYHGRELVILAVLTGLLLGFNLPSNLPIWIILIGALVAIGIGKMTFGGLGCNPFNPALVGRVFLLVSFPVQMTTWPVPGQMAAYLDAETGATPLAVMKEAIKSGDASVLQKLPDAIDMLVGQTGGCLGEVSALALLIGLAYMLARRIVTWHIPVSILATVFVLAGLLHLYNPVYASPVTVLLTGGMVLGACFMATDYVTSPMTAKGQIIYGVAIGLLTVVIRTFGAYPEGMSFAILIMNAFTPLINTYCKPKRFGEVVKK